MWLMTSFGILMPSIRPPKTVPADDNRTIQVRVRVKKHLEILRDEFMHDELGPIWDTPSMDYNFRAYCTPEAWARACYAMALEVDYQKFKPTTESKYNDKKLHSVYNSIWSDVCMLNRPWGGKYSYASSTTSSYQYRGFEGYVAKTAKESAEVFEGHHRQAGDPSFRSPSAASLALVGVTEYPHDRDDELDLEFPDEEINLGAPLSSAEFEDMISCFSPREQDEYRHETLLDLQSIPRHEWSRFASKAELTFLFERPAKSTRRSKRGGKKR